MAASRLRSLCFARASLDVCSANSQLRAALTSSSVAAGLALLRLVQVFLRFVVLLRCVISFSSSMDVCMCVCVFVFVLVSAELRNLSLLLDHSFCLVELG